MSTLNDQPIAATCRRGHVHVTMRSGLKFSFPIAGNPRLEGASLAALNQIELSPFGLHWPELDEDLSIRGLLAGRLGARARRSKTLAGSKCK